MLGSELAHERSIREQASLAGELADLRNSRIVGDRERQHRVRHRTVGHLLVHRQHVAAPVAAGTHLLRGVHHHFGAAAVALHGDQRVGIGSDVGGARADGRSPQGRQVASGDHLIQASLGPLVPAEQADEHAHRGAQLDVGRPALGTAIDPVVESFVAGIDDGAGSRWSGRHLRGRGRRYRTIARTAGGRKRCHRRVRRCSLRVRAPCSWRRRSRPG